MAKKNNSTAEKPKRTPEEIAALREEAKAKFGVSTGSEVQPQEEPQAVAQEEATQGAGFSEELLQAAEAEADRIAAEEANTTASSPSPDLAALRAELEAEKKTYEAAKQQAIEANKAAYDQKEAARKLQADLQKKLEEVEAREAAAKMALEEADKIKEDALLLAGEPTAEQKELLLAVESERRAKVVAKAAEITGTINTLSIRQKQLTTLQTNYSDTATLIVSSGMGYNKDIQLSFENKKIVSTVLNFLAEKTAQSLSQKQTELNSLAL
ncbi:hypothetical protein SAMN05421780_1142 [Flexibacter flexilis DSM 6793]|uniref:Uncharacterized protein n=1 Tax=Flexibacter flexilis DSM 6793 TaxID=927664 RepID=A0A1I1NCI2_9BACT|nr:hypothetical protein [Flexibacter flexilis]SFC95066.1 hypothetical protein SAMN05421780_1142 [Flexibacter flexilis DSM 6793]